MLSVGTSEDETLWHQFQINFKRISGPKRHHPQAEIYIEQIVFHLLYFQTRRQNTCSGSLLKYLENLEAIQVLIYYGTRRNIIDVKTAQQRTLLRAL